MDLFILTQIIVGGAIGSFFYVVRDVANDTTREILINVGFGTTLSVGIAMIVYDIIEKQTLVVGLSMLLGAMGPSFSSQIGKKVIERVISRKK